MKKMKMELTGESRNLLYDRREITAAAVETEATPSRKQVAGELAKLLGVNQECIVIDRIEQRFGRKTAAVRARVYSSPEAAKRFEKAYKFARMQGKKKEGGAPAAKVGAEPSPKPAAPEAPSPAPAQEAKK